MTIRPIFIFSITRSGSTLVQRIIAAHEGVATVSEPWLLLPLLYSLRDQGIAAEYGQDLASTAIADFCNELPHGVDDYRGELRDFVLRLYAQAAGEGASHFVDKSPPYFFVADEIIELFPDAKFVFLWRNPLSILASIVETWGGGRWRATVCSEDLFVGLPRLVSAYNRNRSRVCAVRFEDLIRADSERAWRPLMDYLEIPFDPATLERFQEVTLRGRMGDPVGVKAYSALSAEPMQKWKHTLANPLRREWCRRYLRFLGDERLATMGYDGKRLAAELSREPPATATLLPDLGRLLNDVAREPWRVQIRRRGVGGPNVLRTLLSV
ncbi:MAG TPA: sulfotransferase [Solirubrobacteraceae bacterium]|jgi:hypothetical protein